MKRLAMRCVKFLKLFILDAPHGVLVMADYSDGHLYPLDTKPFPHGRGSGRKCRQDRREWPRQRACRAPDKQG